MPPMIGLRLCGKWRNPPKRNVPTRGLSGKAPGLHIDIPGNLPYRLPVRWGDSDEGIAPLNAGFFRAHGVHRHTHAMRCTHLACRQC